MVKGTERTRDEKYIYKSGWVYTYQNFTRYSKSKNQPRDCQEGKKEGVAVKARGRENKEKIKDRAASIE